jgi:hypothetical protein
VGYRVVKTATKTMNGTYVKSEIPAMTRHRNRQDRASVLLSLSTRTVAVIQFSYHVQSEGHPMEPLSQYLTPLHAWSVVSVGTMLSTTGERAQRKYKKATRVTAISLRPQIYDVVSKMWDECEAVGEGHACGMYSTGSATVG